MSYRRWRKLKRIVKQKMWPPLLHLSAKYQDLSENVILGSSGAKTVKIYYQPPSSKNLSQIIIIKKKNQQNFTKPTKITTEIPSHTQRQTKKKPT